MGYGKVIRRLRGNMPLRKFASIVEISYAHIDRLEKEVTGADKKPLYPSMEIFTKICTKLNYPLKDFLVEAGYIEQDNSISGKEMQLLTIFRAMQNQDQDVLIAYAEMVLKMKNVPVSVD